MKSVDLTKVLKPYKKGWVALNQDFKVIAHANTFKLISDKAAHKKGIVLMPASEDFSGLVTHANV